MIKIKLMAALACAGILVGGCAGPNGGLVAGLGGPGASWKFTNPKISVIGNTILITADEWDHIGTNGYALPSTNSAPANLIYTPQSLLVTPQNQTIPTAELAKPAPRSTPPRTSLPRTGPPYTKSTH